MTMGTVDPTYPLYPIACSIAAVLLLLVFISSFIRQSWTLGVVFLCFWLILDNLTAAVNAIIWSDNADIRLYIYCDIVSHMQIAVLVVQPMSSLLIMRRLYLIASLLSVEPPSKTARRREKSIEWSLGLIIPALVAGPLYYTVQVSRFVVIEGSGCNAIMVRSGCTILLMEIWPVGLPVLSAILYYPRVARRLLQQTRDLDLFLTSNPSMTRASYIRILILATLTSLLLLVYNITLFMRVYLVPFVSSHSLPFYPGWSLVHDDWNPHTISRAALQASGTDIVSRLDQWTSLVHSLIVFGLFGLTEGARASYWQAFRTATGWFGWSPNWPGKATGTRSALSSPHFNRNVPQQDVSLASCELVCVIHLQSAIPLSRPSSSSSFSPSVRDIAPPPSRSMGDVESVGARQSATSVVPEPGKDENPTTTSSCETEDTEHEQPGLRLMAVDMSEAYSHSAGNLV